MPVEPQPVRDILEQKVALPAMARVSLGVVVMAGGLLFALIGVVMLFWERPVPPPHPVGAKFLAVAIAFLGAGFSWIGLRLVRARSTSGNLLSPAARVVCSLVIGAMAVTMLVATIQTRDENYFGSVIGLVLMSYWLYPRKQRR